MEEAEREEKLLVLDLGLAARELPLVDKLVKTLHVRLQTLRINLRKWNNYSISIILHDMSLFMKNIMVEKKNAVYEKL